MLTTNTYVTQVAHNGHHVNVLTQDIKWKQKLFSSYFPHKIFTYEKYNSFMPQRFCNTLEYVNSKQIKKEFVFKKVSQSKHEKICSDMN